MLAIAVGVTAFGSVFTTKEILLSEMTSQFKAVNPSSLVLTIPSGYEPELIRWIENYPGVAQARASALNLVRIFTPQGARNLNLVTLEDFENIQVNKIAKETGAWPPKKKELIFERTSSAILPYNLADSIEVETEKGRRKKLDFVGTVHDMQAIPANLMPELTGYVTFDTLRYLDLADELNKIEVRTDASLKSKDEVITLGNRIKSDLENRGFKDISVRADKPNKHWGEDPSNAFVTILTIIGSFSLLLSIFLVFNTVSAIVVSQRKQIGIMKSIGGRKSQIVSLFLAMTLSYGILALIIALPLGALLAYANLKMVTNFLNLNIDNFYIPLSVISLEIIASLLVPFLAALLPVLAGTRITVQEAISDNTAQKKTGSFINLFQKQVQFLSRPIIISLRNTFRQKGRLILTLVTLTIAGTLFISVIGNRESMLLELDNMMGLYHYDLELFFGQKYDASKVILDAKKVSGISETQTPLYLSGEWQKKDKNSEAGVTLVGVNAESDFTKPAIMSGRMIRPKDTNEIVISSRFTRDDPGIEIGQSLPIKINDQIYNFEIVGVYLLSEQNMGMVSEDYLKKISPDSSQISSIQVRTKEHSQEFLNIFAKDFEQQMKRRGYDVAYSLTINTIRSSSEGQFDFLVFFLLLMAVLVAVVGGLGLAGTMSLNVLERTREIGVMRSLGAANGTVFKLVVTESLIVGLISWALAVPLSLPMTYGFCFAIGKAFFEKVLPFVLSVNGIFLWLGIVIIISIFASIAPARNAVNLTVRDTLAYE